MSEARRTSGALNKREAAAVRRLIDAYHRCSDDARGALDRLMFPLTAAAPVATLEALEGARRKMADKGAVRFTRRRAAAAAPGPDVDAERAAKWGPEGRG